MIEHFLGVGPGAMFRSCQQCDFGCELCSDEDEKKERDMGAGSRGGEAKRVLAMLPEALRVPIVNVMLECYEAGNGTLDGVFEACPRSVLEDLMIFLEAVKVDETEKTAEYLEARLAAGLPEYGTWEPVEKMLPVGYCLVSPPEFTEELIESFLERIDEQLKREHRCADGAPPAL